MKNIKCLYKKIKKYFEEKEKEGLFTYENKNQLITTEVLSDCEKELKEYKFKEADKVYEDCKSIFTEWDSKSDYEKIKAKYIGEYLKKFYGYNLSAEHCVKKL